MIALKDGLPVIVDRFGIATAFRPRRLSDALLRAAARAGYPQWFIAREVSATVTTYLQRQYLKRFITIGCLEEIVRKALIDVGYEEVAAVFGRQRSRPVVNQLTLSL